MARLPELYAYHNTYYIQQYLIYNNNIHAIVSPRLIDRSACDGYTACVMQESPVYTVYTNIIYIYIRIEAVQLSNCLYHVYIK